MLQSPHCTVTIFLQSFRSIFKWIFIFSYLYYLEYFINILYRSRYLSCIIVLLTVKLYHFLWYKTSLPMNFLIFCLLKKYSILFSLLKDSFVWYKILSELTVFFSCTLKILIYCFLPYLVPYEKTADILIFGLLHIIFFFPLDAFKILSSYLVFRSLAFTCPSIFFIIFSALNPGFLNLLFALFYSFWNIICHYLF